MPSARIRFETQDEITAAICTTGPSRPVEPPVDSVISEAERRGDARLRLDPPVVQRGALDHVRDRAHPPVRREAVQDQPHGDAAERSGSAAPRYQCSVSGEGLCSRLTSSVP